MSLESSVSTSFLASSFPLTSTVSIVGPQYYPPPAPSLLSPFDPLVLSMPPHHQPSTISLLQYQSVAPSILSPIDPPSPFMPYTVNPVPSPYYTIGPSRQTSSAVSILSSYPPNVPSRPILPSAPSHTNSIPLYCPPFSLLSLTTFFLPSVIYPRDHPSLYPPSMSYSSLFPSSRAPSSSQ